MNENTKITCAQHIHVLGGMVSFLVLRLIPSFLVIGLSIISQQNAFNLFILYYILLAPCLTRPLWYTIVNIAKIILSILCPSCFIQRPLYLFTDSFRKASLSSAIQLNNRCASVFLSHDHISFHLDTTNFRAETISVRIVLQKIAIKIMPYNTDELVKDGYFLLLWQTLICLKTSSGIWILCIRWLFSIKILQEKREE